MKRADDFETRRQHLRAMSDEELKAYFWKLAQQTVDPLLEYGRTHTTPSVERSVLLRMGFSSRIFSARISTALSMSFMSIPSYRSAIVPLR